MSAMASQITSLTIVYPTVNSGTDQRKHKRSVSLAYVGGIHRSSSVIERLEARRWLITEQQVHSPHKWPITRKMFPLEDVIISYPGYG